MTTTSVISERTESRAEDIWQIEPHVKDPAEDLIDDLAEDVVQLLRALLDRAVDGSIPHKVYAVLKSEPLLLRMALIRRKIEALKSKCAQQLTQETQLVAWQDEITQARVVGAQIMKLILTVAHWVPDWFRSMKVSRTNHELLAWFQEDMAFVEIDWNGVHVLQWFFDPGYELQMSQDEILADVSAKLEDTHLEKLVKFMRT